MHIRFSIAVLSAISLMSCANKPLEDDAETVTDRFGKEYIAYSAYSETRTFISDEGRMYWTEGDEMTVFRSQIAERFHFQGKTGATYGVFTKTDGTVPGSAFNKSYAIFPYMGNASSIDEGLFAIDFPSAQKYTPGSFGPESNVMVATTESMESNVLKFKNVDGYIQFDLYGGANIRNIRFYGNDKENIAGSAVLEFKDNAEVIVSMDEAAAKEISLDCGEGGIKTGDLSNQGEKFWMALPPTVFENGFSIEVTEVGGTKTVKSTNKKVEIKRNTVQPMNPVFVYHYGEHYLPDPNVVKGVSDFNTLTSDEFIEKYYEPLRSRYPDYISRKNIGKDDSGLYDMWCYEFVPENYEKTIYIQAGIHGRNEFESYYATGIMMNLIADASDSQDPHLKNLRKKVRFIVVPVVNVYDVTERANAKKGVASGTTYSPRNSRNINLNRDWIETPQSQEIRNIKSLLAQYDLSEFNFAFDEHTDPEGIPGWGGYLLSYADGMPDSINQKLLSVNNYLYDKNITGQGISLIKAFMGPKSMYPANSAAWRNRTDDESYKKSSDNWKSCSQGFYVDLGIYSSTIEHGARKFGAEGSQIEMLRAVELYLDHVCVQVE